MKKTFSTSHLVVAIGLALALALAGQASVMASNDTATCTLWQKIKESWFRVDCHFL